MSAQVAAEEWRAVAGFPDYDVSSFGRVMSRRACRKSPGEHEVRGTIGRNGYRHIWLINETCRKQANVHSLVLLAFCGPRPEGMVTRHLDGNKLNNALTNLAYGTKSENMLDQVRHGTHAEATKAHCPQNHPYDEVNTYVHFKNGRPTRYCRPCTRENSRQYRARQAALRAASAGSAVAS